MKKTKTIQQAGITNLPQQITDEVSKLNETLKKAGLANRYEVVSVKLFEKGAKYLTAKALMTLKLEETFKHPVRNMRVYYSGENTRYTTLRLSAVEQIVERLARITVRAIYRAPEDGSLVPVIYQMDVVKEETGLWVFINGAPLNNKGMKLPEVVKTVIGTLSSRNKAIISMGQKELNRTQVLLNSVCDKSYLKMVLGII